MKRTLSFLFVLVVILALVAGCGGATPATEVPAEQTEAAPAPATEAPATEAPATEAAAPAEPQGSAAKDPLADGKITIAWIPKALNNPVFEIGKVGAEKKAEELTAQGPHQV